MQSNLSGMELPVPGIAGGTDAIFRISFDYYHVNNAPPGSGNRDKCLCETKHKLISVLE